MINNISITFNGQETAKETTLCVSKDTNDCLLTEWDEDEILVDIDLKEDINNSYNVFVAITDANKFCDKSFEQRFYELREEFIKLQNEYLKLKMHNDKILDSVFNSI
jgi:hypothetical protein